MTERRTLHFESLNEVLPEVDRLLAGNLTLGQWSLAQILNHLRTAIETTCSPARNEAEPTRQQTAARLRFFRTERFPDGIESPLPPLPPRERLEPRAEADGLRAAIARFFIAEGPFPRHPRLGPLAKEEWARFHCLHCAHHLGFAVPA